MAAIVTGASGHVGAALVRELLARGREVKALDLAPGRGLAGLDVQVFEGDIRDADFLRGAFAEGDTLFHLASVISVSGDKGGLVPSVNVDGARNVAQVARETGIRRMVHTSSIHAYDIDSHDGPISEDSPLAIGRSKSAYNISKARGQLAVLEEVDKGLDAVVINPCGVIGPYDYKASRMGVIFRSIARGKKERVGPSGFDWVDVRDVALGALAAEDKGRTGEAYILGGHWNTSLRLSQIAADHLDTEVPGAPVPMWLLQVLAAAKPVFKALGKKPPVTSEVIDALKSNPDMRHDKATAELGYTPRPVEETVGAIMDWLRDEDIVAIEKAERAARRAARAQQTS